MHTAGIQGASFYQDPLQGEQNPEKVAGMFEAMFYRMMLSQVRSASLGDPLFSSSAVRQAEEMLHDEMANDMGKKGELGIANMMLDMVYKKQSPTGLLK